MFLFVGMGERQVPHLQHPPCHAWVAGKSQFLGKSLFVAVMGQGKATDPVETHSEPLKNEHWLPGQDARKLVFAGSRPRSRAKFNKRYIINFRCTCQDVTDTVLERSSILFVSHNVAIILL